jgi:hypothetical protein
VLGQQFGAVRAGDDMGEVDHLEAFQHSLSHGALLIEGLAALFIESFYSEKEPRPSFGTIVRGPRV